MKNPLILFCFTLAVVINSHAFGQVPVIPAQYQHQWTATVKVIGEDGNPMAGTDVSFQYTVPVAPGSGPRFAEIKGLTDDNGIFVASHTDASPGLAVLAGKAGCYTTHIGYQFYLDEKRRHPAFTLMLKKIEKPIAMYAKSITYIKFPVMNKPIGYDLTVGDWVAPYGKGINTDFLFTENHADAKSSYNLIVSFPNQGDGIQGLTRDWSSGVSGLLSLHEAPIDGYQPKYEKTQMSNPDRIYYFRVRTVLDSQGKVLSANYGKIYGDFMQFRYYFNPTPNDRDIEFDPKHNLLGGLESFEHVSAP